MTARKTDQAKTGQPAAESKTLVIYVGGEEFALTARRELDGQDVELPSLDWVDQLSFKEQNLARSLARGLAGAPQGEWGDFAFQDIVPAIVTVVSQRTDSDFTLDQALDLDWDQVTTRPQGAGA